MPGQLKNKVNASNNTIFQFFVNNILVIAIKCCLLSVQTGVHHFKNLDPDLFVYFI